MLVACRLAGLSALGAHYAGVRARTQFGPPQSLSAFKPASPQQRLRSADKGRTSSANAPLRGRRLAP